MNPDIPKHPKLEKARIINNILSCYSNREDVTLPIVTKEEFTKSLKEGDKFFEKKTIVDAIEKAQKENKSLDDLNELISKSEKKIVKDGLKSTEVYIVKAEDIDSDDDSDEDNEVEKSDDDDSDDEMEDEDEDGEGDSEEDDEVEKSDDDYSDDEMEDEGEGSDDDSEEDDKEVEKACMDLKKSENLDIIKGGKRAQIGEIREYNGRKFQKQSNGEWKPYKEGSKSSEKKDDSGESDSKESEVKTKSKSLGETSSGKNIYETKTGYDKIYDDFSYQDHIDAANKHREISDEYSNKIPDSVKMLSGTKGVAKTGLEKKRDYHYQRWVEHDSQASKAKKKGDSKESKSEKKEVEYLDRDISSKNLTKEQKEFIQSLGKNGGEKSMLSHIVNKDGYRFRILDTNKIMVSKEGKSGIMVSLSFDKSKRSLFAD